MIGKYKDYLISIGGGLVIGLQLSGNVPGVTDSPVNADLVVRIIGIGAALGFFVGLANLSKANPNPRKVAVFLAFFIGGVIALVVSFYRGYIATNTGFNIMGLLAVSYLPSMLMGGYAASIFSKSA